MKIAFATQDLKHVDAHFGWAKNIAVYDIAPEGYQFLEAIQFDGDLKEDGNEDKLGAEDRGHQRLRHPLRRGHRRVGRGARGGGRHPPDQGERSRKRSPDLLEKLEAVLKGTPPPWLRKALLKGQERSLDLEDEAIMAEAA